ncbi:MAG: sigma-54-dependent Fis family transcriptional regulator [Gammaproteobacteria bacterium]|jgi:DNA-binding NtrC family response regulator|nr:sigma-54-dependent Fis family transcriptional regulator [Gammaproteobacteria bacterium]MBT4607679.1 sigma-54-dependent Fis family transcriptional regulator [Thiotrichales bacterium]MBT3471460.1 sigma-54-dependent Fis family transcriptional regulator [Gammaproteobacteria bacterium]MBT3967208.1 sigma-54-dependent Fis family transcriptional regulator [Gammaproteobacteria bacterium]MBT4080169.1 sigma-54-dependent Fis family transcriptional regulator [Gammaproteobacteria bacterium]
MKPYILVVDDEPEIRNTVSEILEDEGFEVESAEDGASARSACQNRRPDLILLDIWMPDVDGITLLKEWSSEEDAESLPIIMMSGHGTVETAVEATRLGAYDFLEKPLSLAKLLLTLNNALKSSRLKQENLSLQQERQTTITEPTGKSQRLADVKSNAERIAQHPMPVLIQGESGAGKKLFARFIHQHSPQKSGPFIIVSAGSVASENTNTELFGSESNGQIHYGRLEQANQGTLFLEEIGEMAPSTQARLMGALEAGSFLRVGGTEPIQPHFRIIASTQKNLVNEVSAGNFREDLYFHLNGVPLQVPALRERPEDVLDLLNFYVDYFNRQHNLPYRNFSMAALNLLRQYPWPGNVLELKNLVQRLLIMGAEGEVTQEEVAPMLSMQTTPSQGGAAGLVDQSTFNLPMKAARERFEYEYLMHHLLDTQGNVTQTAERAGVERTNLYRKLKVLNIDPKNLPT